MELQHSYAALPAHFWSAVEPTPVAAPRVLAWNEALAASLGLDPALASSAAAVFSGNAPPPQARPIAMAYAGHQFGHFVPQLGDGRAILLGEVVDPQGRRFDLQLKGAGPTPFSRNGDGRAAIGPVLREYLVSEAMHAMGVPTTRSLAAVATGEHVFREGPVPGAVLARVAASHVRVGTFQYFAARRDTDGVRQLADLVIARHYPDAALAASKKMGAQLILRGTIASRSMLNPVVRIPEVYVTIAFALMKPDGTLLSDAQASAESYSGSDTLAMAGTLVEEKADGVVNTLLGGYCANAASSGGKKRK